MKTTQSTKDLLLSHASPELSVKQIWEKAGKPGALSSAYRTIRDNHIQVSREKTTKPFKYLERLKAMNTARMTINEMLAVLGLHSRNHYFMIRNTLTKNNMKFIKVSSTTKQAKWEAMLLIIDTSGMTFMEIASYLEIPLKDNHNKVYEILKKLGKTYIKAK